MLRMRASSLLRVPPWPTEVTGSVSSAVRLTLDLCGYAKSTSSHMGMMGRSNDLDKTSASDPVSVRYRKAGADDKQMGRAMILAKSRKHREKTGRILLEGKRLIADALAAGAHAHTIFFSNTASIESLPLGRSKVDLVKVTYKDLSQWSDVTTSQGIVGVFSRPSYASLDLDQEAGSRLPLTLICDNVRDPGNLGTILRSAAATACQKVLLTKGCTDAWDPKVLRSGAGAHFRVPIISNLIWHSIPNYLQQGTCLHIADFKRLHHLHAGDHNAETICDNDGQNMYGGHSSSHMDTAHNAKQAQVNDPKLINTPYSNVDWPGADCALVVGGETMGVSGEAAQMCEETGGHRVYIPMSNGVDSLNVAMATSILLFEAQRQHFGSQSR